MWIATFPPRTASLHKAMGSTGCVTISSWMVGCDTTSRSHHLMKTSSMRSKRCHPHLYWPKAWDKRLVYLLLLLPTMNNNNLFQDKLTRYFSDLRLKPFVFSKWSTSLPGDAVLNPRKTTNELNVLFDSILAKVIEPFHCQRRIWLNQENF